MNEPRNGTCHKKMGILAFVEHSEVHAQAFVGQRSEIFVQQMPKHAHVMSKWDKFFYAYVLHMQIANIQAVSSKPLLFS